MIHQVRYDLLEAIRRRWSPRAFDPTRKLTEEDIYPLIEAANLAPSAFNSQPRRFILAATKERRQKVYDALFEGNQQWTHLVPAFVVFVVKATDDEGRTSRFAEFDTGSSFMNFATEAASRGLHTHAMAGFSSDKLKAAFDLAEGLEPIAVVALGYYGDKSNLPEAFQERERPNTRRPIEEMLI